jgi:hypothetical protein
MIRQIIVPAANTYILHLPDDFVGKQVELIAFSTDEVPSEKSVFDVAKKRTIEDAITFFKNNSVDFSKVEKWKREDLYE